MEVQTNEGQYEVQTAGIYMGVVRGGVWLHTELIHASLVVCDDQVRLIDIKSVKATQNFDVESKQPVWAYTERKEIPPPINETHMG